MSQQPQDRRILSPGIVSDPQINGGKAIVEGTRIPVKMILVDLSQGMLSAVVRRKDIDAVSPLGISP